jgi:hypothetical protein
MQLGLNAASMKYYDVIANKETYQPAFAPLHIVLDPKRSKLSLRGLSDC